MSVRQNVRPFGRVLNVFYVDLASPSSTPPTIDLKRTYLTRRNSPETFVRRDLELVVGKVATKDWATAVSLAKELHAWRRERVRRSSSSHPRSSSAPNGIGGGGLSFGDGIAFNFDLDRPIEEDDLDRAFPGRSGSGTTSDEVEAADRVSGGEELHATHTSSGAETTDGSGRRESPGEAVSVNGDVGGVGGRNPGFLAAGKGSGEQEDTSKEWGSGATSQSSFLGKPGAMTGADTVDAGWLYSK